MTIGLFFGSFNPIHIGHMVIANYMAEFAAVDQVWLVVSPQNPLKEKSGLLAAHHRLAMVNEAIGDYRKLKASNIEFKLPQPSYTIDTLTYLKEKHPDYTFKLIMGADNLVTLKKWKNYEILLENYEILVYPRPNTSQVSFSVPHKISFTEAPQMDVSSTFIRKAILDKKDVRFYMPEKAWEYLKGMHFYKK